MHFSTIQWAVIVFSLAVIGLMLATGRKPERLAGLALLVSLTGTPAAEGWRAAGLPMGVVILEVGLVLALFWLCMIYDRWWLLAAAGVQLISPLSYLLAATSLEVQVWAAASARIGVWVVLILTALFGLLEARYAPYAAKG
ncbi:MAG: hypothetical protein ACRED4_05425 [Brevundimonas sp.]